MDATRRASVSIQRSHTPEPNVGATVAEAAIQEHDAAAEIDVAGAFQARMAQMPRGLAPDVFRQQFLDSFEAVARSIADNGASTPRQKVEQFLALESIGQAIGASFIGAEHRLGARSAINEVVAKLIHPKIEELDPGFQLWKAAFDATEAAAQARLATDPDAEATYVVEAALKYIAHLPKEIYGDREDGRVTGMLQDTLAHVAALSTVEKRKDAFLRLAEAIVVRAQRRHSKSTEDDLQMIFQKMESCGVSRGELGFVVNATYEVRGPAHTQGMVRELSNAFDFLKARAQAQDHYTYCTHLSHLEHSAMELAKGWKNSWFEMRSIEAMSEVVSEIRTERLWMLNNPIAAQFLITCRGHLSSQMKGDQLENAVGQAYNAAIQAIEDDAAASLDEKLAMMDGLDQGCVQLGKEVQGEALKSLNSILLGFAPRAKQARTKLAGLASKTPQALTRKLAELNSEARALNKAHGDIGYQLSRIAADVSAAIGEFPIKDPITQSQMYCNAADAIRAARRNITDQQFVAQAIQSLRASMQAQGIPTEDFDKLNPTVVRTAAPGNAGDNVKIAKAIAKLPEAANQKTPQNRLNVRMGIVKTVIGLIRTEVPPEQKFGELLRLQKALDDACSAIPGEERASALQEGYTEMFPMLDRIGASTEEATQFKLNFAESLGR